MHPIYGLVTDSKYVFTCGSSGMEIFWSKYVDATEVKRGVFSLLTSSFGGESTISLPIPSNFSAIISQQRAV